MKNMQKYANKYATKYANNMQTICRNTQTNKYAKYETKYAKKYEDIRAEYSKNMHIFGLHWVFLQEHAEYAKNTQNTQNRGIKNEYTEYALPTVTLIMLRPRTETSDTWLEIWVGVVQIWKSRTRRSLSLVTESDWPGPDSDYHESRLVVTVHWHSKFIKYWINLGLESESLHQRTGLYLWWPS